MKIPQIHGRHKIRDTKICRDYVVKLKDVSTIAEDFGMSGSRVYRILYNNREYLKLDKDFEKTKRVQTLKKLTKGKTTSRKDVVDILDQVRREIEGDKVVNENVHKRITEIKFTISNDTGVPLTQESRLGSIIKSTSQNLSSGKKIREDGTSGGMSTG